MNISLKTCMAAGFSAAILLGSAYAEDAVRQKTADKDSASIWVVPPEQMMETELWWRNTAADLLKKVIEGKTTVKNIAMLCSCSEKGKSLVEAFGDEFMPNALGRYEKTRDRAAELLQTMEEVFPQPVSEGSDTYGTYCKVVQRVVSTHVDLLRARRELAHFYLLHKAGIITNDELSKVDDGRLLLKNGRGQGEPHVLPSPKELGGAAATFAEKFMPDSYRLYQTFTKEYGQLARLYGELCTDASLMDANFDEIFISCFNEAVELKGHMDALCKLFTGLHTLHKIGDVETSDLTKADENTSGELRGFAKDLSVFLREEVLSRGVSIPKMVAIPGKNYSICKYEVTQALWEAVMDKNPSKSKGGDLPVESISWKDCQEFLMRLNALPVVKKSGLFYRLPTADEWEYACRAGSTGKYGLLADGREGNLDEMGWYEDNSGNETHPVGQKKPNAFGLYDMHGNVWEWTSTADGDRRVNCGGCWRSGAGSCESDFRDGSSPDYRSYLGFRLAADKAAKVEAKGAVPAPKKPSQTLEPIHVTKIEQMDLPIKFVGAIKMPEGYYKCQFTYASMRCFIREGEQIVLPVQKIDTGYKFLSLEKREERYFDERFKRDRIRDVYFAKVQNGEKVYILEQDKTAYDTDVKVTFQKDFGDEGEIVVVGEEDFKLGEKIFKVVQIDKAKLSVVIRCDADKSEFTITASGAFE